MKAVALPMLAGLAAAGFAPAMAQDLTVGLKSEATSIDPQYHSLSTNNQVLQTIFEPLTSQNAVQELEPLLATSWEAIDDTTWRFELREDVTFHDGTPFTANDVIYTFCRIPLVQNSPSSFTLYMSSITSMTAEDDHTIIMETAEPNPLLPTDIVVLPILSAETLGAEDDITFAPNGECEGLGDVPQSPAFNDPEIAVGTGPYTFESWNRGNSLTLARFDDYWDGTPDWETVTLRPITSDGPRVAALLAGDVDMIENPPIQDVPRIEEAGFKIVDSLSNRIIYLHMYQDPDGEAPSISGTDGENPLLDPLVREAISLSINRAGITERIMGGYAEPAGELLPPPMFGTSGREVDAYDPERARELLAEAGYEDGFTITLGTPNDRYINDEQVAQAIAQMLAQIGITVNVDAMTASQFFSRRNNQEFPLWLAGWGASSGEMSSPLRSLVASWNPEAGLGTTNPGRYSNEEVDTLVQQAMAELDDTERERMLQEAATIALEDHGIIPLHYEVTVWAMSDDLTYEPRRDQYTLVSEIKPANGQD
ncbi:ABC transporter substrate-binding protein [Palleronia sp. LCG004]|uniref:ABC transporter substrate-binding protein n=1 Tax=Palleronia sp. LCG004 TaxID=3079304 RepID=UPI002943D6D5|nr:ABC transporter substrate-binding protein [Palleronia sp. LCG004]WOI58164.1 ABC transporter substrate-binding protein [Palleronia sp. LCG004]